MLLLGALLEDGDGMEGDSATPPQPCDSPLAA